MHSFLLRNPKSESNIRIYVVGGGVRNPPESPGNGSLESLGTTGLGHWKILLG